MGAWKRRKHGTRVVCIMKSRVWHGLQAQIKGAVKRKWQMGQSQIACLRKRWSWRW